MNVYIGPKIKKERAQLLVNTQKIIKKPENELEEDDQEVLKDHNYVEVLGKDVQGICRVGVVELGMYPEISAGSWNCFAGYVKVVLLVR